MSEELKPCPFCGAHATKYDEDSWRTATKHVLCTVCPASVGPCDTYDEAIAAWNKRAQHAGEAREPVAWYIADENGKPFRAFCYAFDRDRLESKEHKLLPLYAAPQPAALPEGFMLVPIEPTPEMRAKAADAYLGSHGYGDAWISAVYAAMLAAAPQPRE